MYGVLDYYTILGLSSDASIGEIKQSFRRLVLNFILWEIEDLLKNIKVEGLQNKLGEQTIEEVIIYILTFFDKWILNPAGYSDYFFQLRRRFDKFLNNLQKNDLSKRVEGAGVTLFDCVFEAVNLSFHYLGLINLKINKEELTYRRFIFSNRAFDDEDVSYLKSESNF